MLMELHREEKREEGERGGQEDKRGNQKEQDPASNQFPKCSPQPGTHRDSQGWAEKRRGREGDRGDLVEKKESPKGRVQRCSKEQSSQ